MTMATQKMMTTAIHLTRKQMMMQKISTRAVKFSRIFKRRKSNFKLTSPTQNGSSRSHSIQKRQWPKVANQLCCKLLTVDSLDACLHQNMLLFYVSVKSKLQHAPPGNPPGIWLFWKFLFKFPPTRAKMPFNCPTLGSIQVIKFPHPRGHFTGTKMTEGRRKRLQLSNKIFINITKTEQHC